MRSVSSFSLACSAHCYLSYAPPLPQHLSNCDCQKSSVTTNWQINGLVSSLRTCPFSVFDIVDHTLLSSFGFLWFLLTPWPPLFSPLLSFCPSVLPVTEGSVLVLVLYTHHLVISSTPTSAITRRIRKPRSSVLSGSSALDKCS